MASVILAGTIFMGTKTMANTAEISNERDHNGVNEQTIETNIQWTKNNNLNVEFTTHRGANAEGEGSVQIENEYNVGGSGLQIYNDVDMDYDGNGYTDMMAGYVFGMDSDKYYGVLRGGLGTTIGDENDLRIVGEYKNIYTVNERFELEGNVYITQTKEDNDITNTLIELEAYAYGNLPLYINNGFKVEALLEGGLDPASFNERRHDSYYVDEDEEQSYVVYVQPSIKVSQNIGEGTIYADTGYYLESQGTSDASKNEGTDDGMYIEVGAQYKF